MSGAFSTSFSLDFDVGFDSASVELVASSTIDIETTLTDPSQLWGLSRLLLMSWASNFSISTTWITSSITSNNGGQKRISRSGKPSRILRCSILTFQRREAWLLLNMIKRMGQGRSLVPIYSDFTKITVANVATDVLLTCDTTHRRFFDGARIVIAAPTRTAEFAEFEIATILSLGTSGIAITSGLANAYPIGTRIYPLIECDVMLDGPVVVSTDKHIAAQFICKETEGPSSLPPLLEITGTSPYAVQLGYPVFYPQHQWSAAMREGFRGSARTTHSGIGDLFELIGSRPRYSSARNIFTMNRAKAWTVISFFDFVCGSAWPFFVIGLTSPFIVHNVTTTTVTVDASGPLEDWNDLAYLALIKRSTNTPYVVAVSSVTRSDGLDTITFGSAITDLSLDLRSVNPAYLVRFESDEMTENWMTDTKASITYNVLEVLQENSVTLTGI